MAKCECGKPRHKGDYICVNCGGKIPEMYACKDRENCGDLAEKCGHAKPHRPCRCSDCGTWCDQSNAMCQGGACSRMGVPKESFIASRCVPIED